MANECTYICVCKIFKIPSMILQDIKETKRYGHTVSRSFGRSDGQRENSIPTHKHSLRGGIKRGCGVLRFVM